MATESFDYVIVGGGTAGLVVAARLSENPQNRVLVLEAGADHSADPRVVTPALYQTLQYSDADWGFCTVPQQHLNGRTLPVNQGRALGGSSAINAQVFVPPAKALIDAWETLGNPGWNWNALKPYFAKAYRSPKVNEDLEEAIGIKEWTVRNDAAAQGPIQTSFPGAASHPIREAWAETFKTNGLAMAHDPFLEASVGGFSCLASVDPVKKERSYAANTYYHQAKERANLEVLTGARVLKIDFDKTVTPPAPLRATSVQYLLNGEPHTVPVRKDVILAAGVFQSPKVLELSGIGDGALLARHGIPLMQHLPSVGENLHDHLVVGVRFRTRDDLETLDALARQEPAAVAQAIQEYTATRSGQLTSVGVYTYAYLPTPAHTHARLRELLHTHRPDANKPLLSRALHFIAERMLFGPSIPSAAYLSVPSQTPNPAFEQPASDPNSQSATGIPASGKFITIGTLLSHPLSRGSVHIASADPLADPVIDPRYLSHPLDEEVFAQHLLQIKTLAAEGTPLAVLFHPSTYANPDFDSNVTLQQAHHHQSSPEKEPNPHRANNDGGNETQLEIAKSRLRATAISMWHPAGSCAMAARDLGGVVDSGTLCVYGVANVRVVDASAIPLVSTANLQGTVYAFAGRAAEIIGRG